MEEEKKSEILIVEDEVLIAADLESRLKSLGYAVPGKALSAENALNLVEKVLPDLVLMDIVLKGAIDGITAAEIIRDKWGVPVVFLTAYADTDRLEHAKLTYPFGFILKPFQDRDLKITLEMALLTARVDRERRQAEEDLKKYEQIVSSTRDGIACLDRQYRYQIVNRTYEDYSGIRTNELVGKTISDYWGEDVFTRVIKENFDRCLRGETVRYRAWFDYSAVGRRYMQITYFPLIGEKGEVEGVVSNACDITDRKHAEQAMAKGENRYRRLFDSATDEIFLLTEGGRIVDVNEAACLAKGRSREEMLSLDISAVDPNYNQPEFDKFWHNRPHDKSIVFETSHRRRDGSTYPVEVSGLAFSEDGRRYFYGIARDITERKRAEEALKLQEYEREKTIEILNLINHSRSIADLSRAVTETLHSWLKMDAVGLRLKEGDDYPYYVTKGFPEEFLQTEMYLCARDLGGQLLRDEIGNPVLECMCGNIISGRFDPSLPFFTEQGSFWTNSTSEFLATTSTDDRQGRTRNRCHGEGYESLALIPLKPGNEPLGLIQLNDRGKNRFTPHLIAMMERIADNIAIAVARQIAEERTRIALREKEVLLKELHHRVKNNMQVIISLMNLQAGKIEDAELKNAFWESQSRIQAMAVVHEILHQSENLARIDLAGYLSRLCESIRKSHYSIRCNPVIDHKFDPIELKLEKSYPIGLIVNELLSNAMKHGFAEKGEGRVTVLGIRESADKIKLVVEDDGAGLPDGFDWQKATTLGLQIVRTLGEDQLGGSIKLATGPGTRWEIIFPL